MDINHETGLTTLGPRSPQAHSWREVEAITGGLRDVPIELLIQGRIDSKYDLPIAGRCGRLGCKKLHGIGFIFAIPGGRYVNIGNCCADKYAPEEMALIKNAFKDWEDERFREESLRQITDAAREKDQWLTSVEPLAARGTDLRNSFLRVFRGQVETDILKRAEKRQPRVERPVSVCASTIDARRAMLQGGRVDVADTNIRISRFEVHHVGDLQGLEIFRPQRDPMSQWIRFRTSVNALLKSVHTESGPDGMRVLHRIRREFGSQYNDVVASLRATDDFFSQKNLDLIAKMPINRGKRIKRITVQGSEVRMELYT